MSIFGKNGDAFSVIIGGKPRNIELRRGGGKYTVYVDGEYRDEFKPDNVLTALMGDLGDYVFWVDGVKIIAAMRYGRVRLAVDGVYTDNGAEFASVLPLPKWAWAFVAAILLPPVVFGGELFDLLSAVCFVYMVTQFILRNPDIKADTTMRILYSVAATVASWGLFGLFWYLSNGR